MSSELKYYGLQIWLERGSYLQKIIQWQSIGSLGTPIKHNSSLCCGTGFFKTCMVCQKIAWLLGFLVLHWFHVTYFFMLLHKFMTLYLEFWLSFQPAFYVMQPSLCKGARWAMLLLIHLCAKSNHKPSIRFLDCTGDEMLFTCLLLYCYGGLLHRFHLPEAIEAVL